MVDSICVRFIVRSMFTLATTNVTTVLASERTSCVRNALICGTLVENLQALDSRRDSFIYAAWVQVTNVQ